MSQKPFTGQDMLALEQNPVWQNLVESMEMEARTARAKRDGAECSRDDERRMLGRQEQFLFAMGVLKNMKDSLSCPTK